MDFDQPQPKEELINSRLHNQIIHFDNKTKATILRIKKVWQDTLVHIVKENDTEYIINPDRVLYVEIRWLE